MSQESYAETPGAPARASVAGRTGTMPGTVNDPENPE